MCYATVIILFIKVKLNIVGDFTEMNIEIESEKSSAEIAATPLWKYVTKLEKASVGGGNVAFQM